MTASYAIPVRQASVLPSASFRFHLAMDTLAVRLTVPLAGPVEDLHLQVGAPCRAHEKNENEKFSFPFFMLTPCLEEQGMKQGETRNYN